MSSHLARIAKAFTGARRRDGRSAFIGEAELYCENGGCSVREVTIRVKEFDGPTPADLRCPACHDTLKIHHALTFQEANQQSERQARASVNAQRFVARERQRLGDPRATVPVPIGVLLDDSLEADE